MLAYWNFALDYDIETTQIVKFSMLDALSFIGGTIEMIIIITSKLDRRLRTALGRPWPVKDTS